MANEKEDCHLLMSVVNDAVTERIAAKRFLTISAHIN